MEATRIVAIRHGETAWNVGGRIQGHLDIPLNATGRAQAARTAQVLADEPFDALYTSDLARTRETAQALAEVAGLPLALEPRLRERAFGRFEGSTFPEIEAAWPDEALRWRKRDPAYAPGGGGESLLALRERITAVMGELAARHAGGQIAVVTHGGVLDILYRAATGQELQAPRTWLLGNAAINRLLWTASGLTLVGWSDDAHLGGMERDEISA